MGYFNPLEAIKKIAKETGISNKEAAPKSLRSEQPAVKARKKTPAQIKAKQRQYFIDRGEGVPPHLQ